MDHDGSTALRQDTDDDTSRRPMRAGRSAENEARIVAHLRSVLLSCGRSPVWG
ncbi:hypothetical protein ACFW16_03460 [Inquilinus sp. NPDC058860]|uniref:hypothetical protein n=1 Tax=Inquilinus sp. NPDC058860 TaxID=3346652 RepID=UPI0036A299CA